MPAKGAKAKEPVEEELTIPLSAEERRSRVAAVRKAGGDLQKVENTLLDLVGRLPGLVAEVQRIRGVVEANTRPFVPAEEGQGD